MKKKVTYSINIIIIFLLSLIFLTGCDIKNINISSWDKLVNYIEEQNNKKIQYITYDNYFDNNATMEISYNSVDDVIEIEYNVESMIFDKNPELYFRDLCMKAYLKKNSNYMNIDGSCTTVIYKEKICEVGKCNLDINSYKKYDEIKLDDYNMEVYGLYGYSDGASPYTHKEFYNNSKRNVAMFLQYFNNILENSEMDITINDLGFNNYSI